MITFGSVASGIEAASVAFNPIGWHAAWLAEIEAAPNSVLRHHYPDVPNLGDMTKIAHLIRDGFVPAPDVFCGGTPCQAFSVAGLRNSLDDARGNLSLTFCEIANDIDDRRAADGFLPAVIVWENVPGVLSTKDNAFGCFLAGLAGEDDPLVPAGDKWTNAGCVFGPRRAVAWRVLDAQYFGVAQQRRRVFVVASARDGFDPTTVLFEFDGVRRDSAPRRETREETSGTIRASAARRGGVQDECGLGLQPVAVREIARCIATREGCSQDFETTTMLAMSVALRGREGGATAELGGEVSGCLRASGGGGDKAHALVGMAVRRLTPRECERLQGFPDDYTLVPGKRKNINPEKLDRDYIKYLARGGVRTFEECMNVMADGPRYKALGNSWAVPNVAWIGRRIAAQLL